VISKLHREDGTTLIEMLTVLAMLGIVLGFVLSFLDASQKNFDRDASRSQSNDEVRLAIQSLDREVRSGNVLYDPAQESYAPGDVVAGMSVRIYTQSNDTFKCVQWRITSGQELQRRDWSPNWQDDPATLVHGWRTIATGIRNRAESKGAAFSRPSTNLMIVNFWANADPNAKKGKSVDVQASISGRNTIFYTSNQLCGPAVPDPALTGTGDSRVPSY